MKAAVYEGVGKVGVKEIDEPKLVSGSVIIKIDACAICGTDLKAYVHGNARIRPPLVLGHEFVGTISDVGDGVSGLKAGDRVTMATTIPCGECSACKRNLQNLCDNRTSIGMVYDGAFAEYMLVPPLAVKQGNVIPVPDNLSSEDGSIAEPLSCVINGQTIAGVGEGDVVVVVGAGPIGYLHVETAKAKGAKTVILVEYLKERLEFAKNFKVDHTICSKEEDAVKKVAELTGGVGADVVIVAAPVPEAQVQSIDLVAKGGRISFFASIPKDNPFATLPTNVLHYKEIRIFGASDSRIEHVKAAIDMLASGKFNAKALITHTFPLSDFMEALEVTKRKEGLKVVIKP